MEETIGLKQVMCNSGEMKEISEVCSGTDLVAIGIYFSAHWCPPCRGFTPILTEFYSKVNKETRLFEVVFVSSDRDEDSFKKYFANMPWHAIPYEMRSLRESLGRKYSVQGIPTLIILNKDGSVVSNTGRGDVQGSDGAIPKNWLK